MWPGFPPGHFLVVRESEVRLQRYFTFPEPVEVPGRSERDCLDQFQALLVRAVDDRLRTPKVAIYLSGGVDSPLVARTAKGRLESRFSHPTLRAFTCVYDWLIPDDERAFTTLAAESVGIDVDFQALDAGAPFDWVGRASPPQPIATGAAAPVLDQVFRIAREFPVLLTGYDGDALLGAAVRLHWGERMRQGRIGPVLRELGWYVRHQRRLPPVGVRTRLARIRRAGERVRRPPWLAESFWRRADLEDRWTRALRPRDYTHSREPAIHGFVSPAWGGLLDAHDPAFLGRPLEVRHPLVDLRLIRFALGLAAVPWCVNKYLLRQSLVGFPESIRRRPKTPLRKDPVAELIRGDGIDWSRIPWQALGELSFLDRAELTRSLPPTSAAAVDCWPAVRALELVVWFAQRAPPLANSPPSPRV